MAGTYSLDPSLVNVPIPGDELDAILAADPRTFRDPQRLQHLLQRLYTSVLSARTDVTNLTRELHAQRAQFQQVGRPTTLSPVEAARYCSDEQLLTLFRGQYRRELQMLRSGRDALGHVVEDLVQIRDRASSDPDVPDWLRNELDVLVRATHPEQRPT
jgi:hypothetical protein